MKVSIKLDNKTFSSNLDFEKFDLWQISNFLEASHKLGEKLEEIETFFWSCELIASIFSIKDQSLLDILHNQNIEKVISFVEQVPKESILSYVSSFKAQKIDFDVESKLQISKHSLFNVQKVASKLLYKDNRSLAPQDRLKARKYKEIKDKKQGISLWLGYFSTLSEIQEENKGLYETSPNNFSHLKEVQELNKIGEEENVRSLAEFLNISIWEVRLMGYKEFCKSLLHLETKNKAQNAIAKWANKKV